MFRSDTTSSLKDAGTIFGVHQTALFACFTTKIETFSTLPIFWPQLSETYKLNRAQLSRICKQKLQKDFKFFTMHCVLRWVHFTVTWCGKPAKLQDLGFWKSRNCLRVPEKLSNASCLVRHIQNWNSLLPFQHELSIEWSPSHYENIVRQHLDQNFQTDW